MIFKLKHWKLILRLMREERAERRNPKPVPLEVRYRGLIEDGT